MADWLRTVVPVEADSRGPIGTSIIPTVRLTADQGCGLVRVTLRDDDIDMLSFTVPFLPVGARLTIDGRDGKVIAFYDGIERVLPAFVRDWAGDPINSLDVSAATGRSPSTRTLPRSPRYSWRSSPPRSGGDERLHLRRPSELHLPPGRSNPGR